MMKFKPNLAPNDQPTKEDVSFPKYVSLKLDGIRTIFKDGEMLSRSLKQIQSTQLQGKFCNIKDDSKDVGVIYDGELYAHGRSFQEITKAVMTQDIYSTTSIKRIMKEQSCTEIEANTWAQQLIDDIKFHAFDMYDVDEPNQTFEGRYKLLNNYMLGNNDAIVVTQRIANTWEEAVEWFNQALKLGYEGLMLKDPKATYKCGRNTIKEDRFFKFKPYVTVDSKVIGFVQATEVREGAEKKINELGRSVTSKKKADRVPVGMASGVTVDWKGQELIVNLSQTHEERKEIWENQEKYLGKYIEFKYLDVGMKDLPRHPNSIRWRFDKDDD